MKNKTACFTGHRDIPPLKRPGIKHRLEREIERSIQAGYEYFGAGGALGFDTLAAQTVLKLKERYPDIRNKLMNNIGEKASTAAKPDSSELL